MFRVAGAYWELLTHDDGGASACFVSRFPLVVIVILPGVFVVVGGIKIVVEV